jgi:putative endonuclease
VLTAASTPHRLGRRGERRARRFLRRRGYLVLAARVRYQGGEVDLVALRDGVLVLVEVKTRRPGHGTNVAATLTVRKRRSMLRVGRRWLTERGARQLPVRLALVTVQYRTGWWRPPRVLLTDPLP